MATKAGRLQLRDIRVGSCYYLVTDVEQSPELAKIAITDFYKPLGRIRFYWERFEIGEKEPDVSIHDKSFMAGRFPFQSPAFGMKEKSPRGVDHLKLTHLVHWNGSQKSELGAHIFVTKKAAIRYITEHHAARVYRRIIKDLELGFSWTTPLPISKRKPEMPHVSPRQKGTDIGIKVPYRFDLNAFPALQGQEQREAAAKSQDNIGPSFNMNPDIDLE